MKRRSLLLAAVAAPAARGQDGAAAERLRQLQQARAGVEQGPLTPERTRQRLALLHEAEAALARVQVMPALALFEQAAALAHAADTEIGLVRCYMQAGEYRRALAFGAHTAGAHLDVIGGTALYAWLLAAGAQQGVAGQLLGRAEVRSPRQPLLQAVRERLALPLPHAHDPLLHPPVRLAPYADHEPGGRVVCAATLLAGGRAALAPARGLRGARRCWVRNGLGATVAAEVGGKLGPGLLELALRQRLPEADAPFAPADPFPGSVVLPVAYARQPDAAPSWPWMKSGFLGAPSNGRGVLHLGLAIGEPAGWGGPVFDQSGRVAGVAMPGDHREPLLIGAGWLRAAAPRLVRDPAPGAAAARAGLDAVYEAALRQALQVIAS